jgi:sugar fermentation stimulation protein A
MIFSQPLLEGVLLRRYQRFLADVRLASGTTITAHTSNTGAMLGCATPGSRVWLSRSHNVARKHPWTWELVESGSGVLVGINTALANRLVGEAIEQGVITELAGYPGVRAEVAYGQEGSRADFLLTGHARAAACYVEVKNVTAVLDPGVAVFPDAVSARGAKHLRELQAVVASGQRALMCYCVQRKDAREVRPADAIDPRYGATLRQALAAGVEAVAYVADVSPNGIQLRTRLPLVCP